MLYTYRHEYLAHFLKIYFRINSDILNINFLKPIRHLAWIILRKMKQKQFIPTNAQEIFLFSKNVLVLIPSS